MNDEDYAVVVGIAKYPGLGSAPTMTADLQAPVTDAMDVYKWLVDPNGGGIQDGKDGREAHVKVITSDQFPSTNDVLSVEPQISKIQQAFAWLQLIAEKNDAEGKGRLVGRRLYIYMSGHGFSPSRLQGGVYLANATPVQTFNTFASGWLEWFQDIGYFKEFVLWLDSCMDREFTVVPENIPFRKQGASVPSGPTFICFAAPRPLKTVERPIAADNGKVHGVFTWTLLEGLRGAAADPNTRSITARSLGDYLINGMKSLLWETDMPNQDIAKEPEVVKADPTLVFATNVASRKYSIRLRFSTLDADGKQAYIWSGNPPAKSAPIAIMGGVLCAELETGLHVVEVPECNLRQGFEVTASNPRDCEITETGPPVQSADSTAVFNLSINPNDVAAQIFLIDSGFALKIDTMRSLSTYQPWGIYKIKVRLGRDVKERIVLLDRDNPELGLTSPQIVSAAPILGTALTHEYHVAAAQGLSTQKILAQHGSGSEVRIMARVWGATPDRRQQLRDAIDGTLSSVDISSWSKVTLLDGDGNTLLDLKDLKDQAVHFTQSDPFVTSRLEVSPGSYFLRQRLDDGRMFEQSLIAASGWGLDIFLLSFDCPGNRQDTSIQANRCPPLAKRSLLMSKLGSDTERGNATPKAKEDTVLEAARIALVDGRHILNPELEALLFQKYINPIAGVIGAHLVIMEAANPKSESSPSLEILNQVVPNLRGLLGSLHPDVEAISLLCPDPNLRASKPFTIPPMFHRSWGLIIDASEDNPELVPNSLWARIHAAVNFGGYLVWACDARSQSAHLSQLKTWVSDAVRAIGAPGTAGETPKAAVQSAESDVGVFASKIGPNLMPTSQAALEQTEGVSAVRKLAQQIQMPAAAFESLWNSQVGKGD
jgi:hypothetical protein